MIFLYCHCVVAAWTWMKMTHQTSTFTTAPTVRRHTANPPVSTFRIHCISELNLKLFGFENFIGLQGCKVSFPGLQARHLIHSVCRGKASEDEMSRVLMIYVNAVIPPKLAETFIRRSSCSQNAILTLDLGFVRGLIYIFPPSVISELELICNN